jgi:hypothetical protein
MDAWSIESWLAHQRLIIWIGTRKVTVFGTRRNLPDGSIIARHGAAGYETDTLTPGLHLACGALQFRVELLTSSPA